MQINLVKYIMTLNTFKRELNDLLNTKIPEGYVKVDVKIDSKENTEIKNSKL